MHYPAYTLLLALVKYIVTHMHTELLCTATLLIMHPCTHSYSVIDIVPCQENTSNIINFYQQQ